ncbi:MAG: GDSL-type esterase/lipase family protein [Pseudomonadota bacterium]|nr:GDSL-type esterase/lipase family protein [Pseudomonadota bacterium]
MPDRGSSGLFNRLSWPKLARWLLLPPAAVAAGFLFAEKEPGFRTLDGVSVIRTSLHKINRSLKSDRPEMQVTVRVNPVPVALPTTMPEPRPEPAAEPVAAAMPGIAPVAVGPLAGFYRGLREIDTGTRARPVTILHLGDSHIAADRFSGDLRSLFQARFGNAGRGMMMPGFPFPYYRAQGVEFSKTGAWTASNSFRNDSGPYGVTGVRLTTRQGGATLSLTSEDGPFEWAEATFLTGAGMGAATVSVGQATETTSTAGKDGSLRRVRIERKGSKMTVTARGDGPVSVLSWAIGYERPGVRYVSFGIPGATAETTRRWDDALLAADIERLNPDLVILGFGTNEGFNDGLNLSTYSQRVTELMGRISAAAPQVSFLIIGPGDSARLPRFAGGSRRDLPCRDLDDSERANYTTLLRSRSPKLARWHPPAKLGEVRHALKEIAQSQGAMFWDWSRAMGGPCGIQDWVRSQPALAAGDYVHITAEGARRSARMLFTAIMAGYSPLDRLAAK